MDIEYVDIVTGEFLSSIWVAKILVNKFLHDLHLLVSLFIHYDGRGWSKVIRRRRRVSLY